MRKISTLQVLFFFSLLAIILSLGFGLAYVLFGQLALGDFRGIVLLIAAIVFVYGFAFIFYRLLLKVAPLKEGEIAENSKEEFVYHVYLLFFLILFYPVMRSGFFPVPMMRLVYLALGAKLGDNTYSSGIILDPIFVEAGSNTIIGQFALLIPHVIEGTKLAHYPIKLGNNVTIGAHSVVMSNVTIEDHAIVSVGAVVTKNTHIGKGEIWGGVPAKRLR